jgi:hypothetical protein
MFAAVDSLLTATYLTLALGDFELAVEDVIEPHVTFFPPPWSGEVLFLDDLLDDGLNWRRFEGRLDRTRRAR